MMKNGPEWVLVMMWHDSVCPAREGCEERESSSHIRRWTAKEDPRTRTLLKLIDHLAAEKAPAKANEIVRTQTGWADVRECVDEVEEARAQMEHVREYVEQVARARLAIKMKGFWIRRRTVLDMLGRFSSR